MRIMSLVRPYLRKQKTNKKNNVLTLRPVDLYVNVNFLSNFNTLEKSYNLKTWVPISWSPGFKYEPVT